ncbi:MAG: ABC-2 family transporter protein [Anaerolineaceae bacterium]|nr:ABC-2 family transporter protein [Anaerolineaceae bacterium]
MIHDLQFLLAVWKANLLSAMEYRVSFISQVIGMILNNAIYFLIWVIFFERFRSVRGWGITDMFVTFGITASAFGLVSLFFGNAFNLGDIITKGRLDYYLSLPRPVLLHAVASRSVASGMGDLTYGLVSYLVSGVASLEGLLRFFLAALLAAGVFAAFLIIVQSLAFWIGTTSYLSNMALNAMITFAIYPITLFDPAARLILFTLIPAALMGAVPASFVRSFGWDSLAQLGLGTLVFLLLAVGLFYSGLRRYESGSATQIEI